MNIKKWLEDNTESLKGKKVVVTGASGGIGRELCRHLLSLEASLIIVDRNKNKSDELIKVLKSEFFSVDILQLIADMEDISSVDSVCGILSGIKIDCVILNAGAYSIPRHKCSTGYDNVFQINFVSPYYMAKKLLGDLRRSRGTLIAVGSIAHNYSKIDRCDIDFSGRKKASLVYGNAKRYLMYSLDTLFKDEKEAGLAIVHPGITFTGITAHYPPLIFAIIKHPMKFIFMKPKKAALCIIKGVFDRCESGSWIGPRLFDVWGFPKNKLLKDVDKEEQGFIYNTAEKIFSEITENLKNEI